jgi:DNA-binding MarR family transcriptional regulator
MSRLNETRLGLEPLPLSEFEVLRFVGEHPAPSITQVAQGLVMQPSNVSAAVRALAGRGLLDRCPDAHDRRITRLQLTPLAREHRQQMDAVWATALSAALAQLPPVDADALLAAKAALRHLADVFGRTGIAPYPTASGATLPPVGAH